MNRSCFSAFFALFSATILLVQSGSALAQASTEPTLQTLFTEVSNSEPAAPPNIAELARSVSEMTAMRLNSELNKKQLEDTVAVLETASSGDAGSAIKERLEAVTTALAGLDSAQKPALTYSYALLAGTELRILAAAASELRAERVQVHQQALGVMVASLETAIESLGECETKQCRGDCEAGEGNQFKAWYTLYQGYPVVFRTNTATELGNAADQCTVSRNNQLKFARQLARLAEIKTFLASLAT